MLLNDTTGLPKNVRTTYAYQPVFPLDEPWQWGIVGLVGLLFFGFLVWYSVRDSRGKPILLRGLLLALRLLVAGGLIVFFIHPIQRSETRLIKNSRLILLLDTSLSMGLSDFPSPAAGEKMRTEKNLRRIDKVVNWLKQDHSLAPLRSQHDVAIYEFSESDLPKLICELPKFDTDSAAEFSGSDSANLSPNMESTHTALDWTKELVVRGTATKIGDAVQSIVNQERGGPIAGLILVTDGRSNAGLPTLRAIAAAESAGVPIFPIGMGRIEVPRNVKIADIQAPPRVFPGDKFQIKGIVKASGFGETTIQVNLVSVDEQQQEAELLESETTIRLHNDEIGKPVEFNLRQTELGKRRYMIRISNVAGDSDPRDNERRTLVEVVDRQTKVLLIAGGPLREYRFLRNQLYRDKEVNLHVWLQSALAGADQESDRLLTEFPTSREQLFEFDCIVAFDPDWRALSNEQASLLERWVAEQAGGLVVVAGPVNTPEWTRRPRGDATIDQLRRLYPVSFYSQGTAQLKLGRFGGDTPFPLDFTREGRAAEYLWLGDSATDSQANWDGFAGVFGYYSVNEPKPGADVLAYFSDADTAVDERLPIYLASQYYGAGRVFFQASGEMWRIRRRNVDFFQQYYTKLIRWASQGRLLRDSKRGVLLADRERCWMGDQVSIQAMLRTVQDEPMLSPSVNASLMRPDGSTERIVLRSAKNAVRSGTYTGQFVALNEGEYRVSLPIPDSSEMDVLTTTVQADIPDLEQEKPQRNDELLSEMAKKTRGHYYIGLESFSVPAEDPRSPFQLIQPQDQVSFLTGTPNPIFHRQVMMWLMGIMTAALALEWTLRRLNKLA